MTVNSKEVRGYTCLHSFQRYIHNTLPMFAYIHLLCPIPMLLQGECAQATPQALGWLSLSSHSAALQFTGYYTSLLTSVCVYTGVATCVQHSCLCSGLLHTATFPFCSFILVGRPSGHALSDNAPFKGGAFLLRSLHVPTHH